MSPIEIRPEIVEDSDAIREVNRVAFENHPHSQGTEPAIVDALRANRALDVSLVAVICGEIVGHVAFSRAVVGDVSQGRYLLGPLAVLPTHQNRGVGSALVEAGLVDLRALGALGCVLIGDPDYYGRFGFRATPGLTYEGVPDRNVLSLAFAGTAPRGVIRAHEAFSLQAHRADGAR